MKPEFLDIGHGYRMLPLYVSVSIAKLDEVNGARVLITELPKGMKGAQLGFYLCNDMLLDARKRRDYLEAVLRNTIRAIDDLFKDCDSPDCPNCGGGNA